MYVYSLDVSLRLSACTALLTSLLLLTCMQILLQGREVYYSLIETCRLGKARQWEISHSSRCTCSTCSVCSTHTFTLPMFLAWSSASSAWWGFELLVPEGWEEQRLRRSHLCIWALLSLNHCFKPSGFSGSNWWIDRQTNRQTDGLFLSWVITSEGALC